MPLNIPDLKFDGYRLRFGYVTAMFVNAKWQNPRLKTPGAATLFFYARHNIEEAIAERKAAGLNISIFDGALANWPTPGQLRLHPGWPTRSPLFIK